ncbi:hypothetical protein AB0933_29245 [Streptomyces venezuelae]|uniref:hypothetical protein n=1 Tax=Streptomyces venezuelae TaxID=54571 RepID=UPI00345716D8
MPDRSRPSSPPQDPESQGPESRGPGAQGTGKDDDNPFAPPPEGTPDRPWQPRRPSGDSAPDGDDSGGGGHGSPWGSQWSDRQPGRSQGGFGDRPRQQNGPGKDDPSAPGGNGGGMRWDPTDPAQRRARYALLSGMWGFFFALFGWRYVALLLGALAAMWAIQSLRAKPRRPDPTAPTASSASTAPTGATATTGSAGPSAPTTPTTPAAPAAPVASSTRPQTTAAISGLVTGALALLMVAGTFTAQLVYQDYYTCVDDALTSASKQSCEDLLPKQLRPLLGEED